MLEAVTEALATIRRPGTFAVRSYAPTEDLQLSVKGVGALRFPVPAVQARRLIKVAKPAPFGWREETRVDPTVRNTWEVARSRVKIDARRWKQTLVPELCRIREGLGLPEGAVLKAKLDKLLVYEAGQFFLPHQDTEKQPGMVASLVVGLPSTYSGGASRIEHGEERVEFRRTARMGRELCFVAFYADCRHEVREVKSGYRVALVYTLALEGAGHSLASLSEPHLAEALAPPLRAYFEAPVPTRPYGRPTPERSPDKLVVLLDHEYTRQGLRWDRLKNGDGPRASALASAAQQLDCEVFLAQADVYEHWSVEGTEDWDPWGRRGYYDEEDEEDEEDEGDELPEADLELVELNERHVSLFNWAGLAGKGDPGLETASVDESELCWTRSNGELVPYKAEHEGYMGNYGDTLERWYHRAAVVLWPRERGFRVRAQSNPSWALGHLLDLFAAGEHERGHASLEAALPVWNRLGYGSGRAECAKLLRLAGHVEATLASRLLESLRLQDLGRSAVRPLVLLYERHGEAWCKNRFAHWVKSLHESERGAWVRGLPALFPSWCKAGSSGKRLATLALDAQASATLERCASAFKVRNLAFAQSQLPDVALEVVQVVRATLSAKAEAVRDRMLAALTHDGCGLPTALLVEALRKVGAPELERLYAFGFSPLRERCAEELATLLDRPPRPPGDWSIEPPSDCACALCERLARFLSAPTLQRQEWKLAKNGRLHVHRTLDGGGFPVRHTTRRQGSPYTLVLTKTKALFEREREQRAQWQAQLAWLREGEV